MFNIGARSRQGVPQQRINSTDYYPFRGGLNLIDPFLSIQPGQLLACMNYEPYWRGGYRRVKGYERFDGRPQPHKARFITIVTDGDDSNLSVDDAVDWDSASGSATVIYVTNGGDVTIGDVTGDDPVVGTVFNGNTVIAVLENDTGTDEENTLARTAAETVRRDAIQSVPGSGPIRGVVNYCGNVYAFRDNVGGTACVMYESSSSGWTEVALNQRLRFTGGELEMADGDTITGASSGATAEIERLRIKSGFISNQSAAGYVILSNIVGSFTDGENITIDGVQAFVASGTLEQQVLAPGGRYEFRISTFDNKLVDPRLYGVDGKNAPWEYDCNDGVFGFIETGMDPDTPSFIANNNNMLMLSFQGGSIQNSAPNDPWTWSVVSGAGEILIGDQCTGFVEEVDNALLIYSEEQIKILYGRTAEEFNLVTLNTEMGAVPYTAQRIGSTVHLDQRGVSSVVSSDRFGNFVPGDLSQLIKPLLDQKTANVFGSQISRSLNLWRLFYTDGTAVVLGFHGTEPAGFTLIDYGRPVTALWSSQTEGNIERAFFGSDDGFVYEQDVGRNFDGNPIEAFVLLVFYHSGSPEQNKRYRKAVLEMSGFQASISGSIDVNYGGTGATGAVVQEIGTEAAGGFWDVAEWAEFKWSQGVGSDPSFYIEDTGFNVGLHLYHNSATELEHVLHGINITWSPRRLKREF